ncbi:MAG TPA: type II toxin-antitoxin system VapC family toxin [Gammaproteobacteria bacterium]|jgi:predicted nucleic acid-binding protein|nr:type II toxin-antitoxin system VapC family toxin [Gammaproteobacteria bacterium]
MILLDTNVISELMRSEPEAIVLDWVDQLNRETTYISTINQAEILQGVMLLPDGKRKQQLIKNAKQMLQMFEQRILPFDIRAAEIYAEVVVERQLQGRPIHFQDAQIAAITIEYNCAIATRNVSDFEEIERLKVINPWQQL